jgi:hypothetical protein
MKPTLFDALSGGTRYKRSAEKRLVALIESVSAIESVVDSAKLWIGQVK